jgi:hypothetical protein
VHIFVQINRSPFFFQLTTDAERPNQCSSLAEYSSFLCLERTDRPGSLDTCTLGLFLVARIRTLPYQ